MCEVLDWMEVWNNENHIISLTYSNENYNDYKFIIYDNMGRLVFESRLENQLNPNLENGNYIYVIIEIENNNMVKTGKVMFMSN